MRKKLTITLDQDVYDGLHRMVGRGHISRFLSDLARLHLMQHGYAAMAADEEHEREAMAWIEGVLADVADETG